MDDVAEAMVEAGEALGRSGLEESMPPGEDESPTPGEPAELSLPSGDAAGVPPPTSAPGAPRTA